MTMPIDHGVGTLLRLGRELLPGDSRHELHKAELAGNLESCRETPIDQRLKSAARL